MSTIINGTSNAITFPDSSVQNTSAIVSGYVPYANLPAGSVLQVVQVTNAVAVSTTSTSYVNTNLTASITPKFATSKILVNITSCYDLSNSGESFGVQLVRNGSSIYVPQGGDAGPLYGYANGTGEIIGPIAFSYIDSPATTSSTTYTMQVRKRNGASTVVIPTSQGSAGTQVIILMEIAA